MPSGTGGMGTGSDTRMYNPRSESSRMYSNRGDEDDFDYSSRDYEGVERRKDEKQEKEEMNTSKDLPHLRVEVEHPAMQQGSSAGLDVPPAENEEPVMDDDENAMGAEISQLTGMPGSMGAQLDQATGARTGTGSSMGGYRPLLATGEPMEAAWSSLMKGRTQAWRPSTGTMERARGGRSPSRGATAHGHMAARTLSRYGSGGGIDDSHEALERRHLGLKTKQPMRLFPGKYKEYRGAQHEYRRIGSMPYTGPGFEGQRHFSGGTTGGGRISMLPGQQGVRSSLSGSTPGMKTPKPPKIKPSQLAKLLKADTKPIMDYLHFSQLRSMLRRMKDLLERKESQKKSTANFQGGPGEVGHRDGGTTNPQGATENVEAEERKSENAGLVLIGRGSGRVG